MNLKVLYFFVFLGLLMGMGELSFASLDKPESYKEIYIYNKTLKLCKSDEFSLKNLVSIDGYTDVAKIVFDSALETVTHFKLDVSSNLQDMLSEYWFYRALNECYGDNRLRKDFFVISLLAADRAGKIATVVGGGFIAKKLILDTFGYTVYLAGKAKAAYVVNVLRYSANPALAVKILSTAANPKLYAAYYAFNIAFIVDGVISSMRELSQNKSSSLDPNELESQILEKVNEQSELKVSPEEIQKQIERVRAYEKAQIENLRAQKAYLQKQLEKATSLEEKNKINLELKRIDFLLSSSEKP